MALCQLLGGIPLRLLKGDQHQRRNRELGCVWPRAWLRRVCSAQLAIAVSVFSTMPMPFNSSLGSGGAQRVVAVSKFERARSSASESYPPIERLVGHCPTWGRRRRSLGPAIGAHKMASRHKSHLLAQAHKLNHHRGEIFAHFNRENGSFQQHWNCHGMAARSPTSAPAR